MKLIVSLLVVGIGFLQTSCLSFLFLVRPEIMRGDSKSILQQQTRVPHGSQAESVSD